MEWHKYCEIHRIDKERTKEAEREFQNQSLLSKFIEIMFNTRMNSWNVYQHGIQLINEKGETKDVWEKLKCVNQQLAVPALFNKS